MSKRKKRKFDGESIYLQIVWFFLWGFIPVIGYIAGYMLGKTAGKIEAYRKIDIDKKGQNKQI